MGAWSKNANAGAAVTMLADGNGAFADAVGLTMDGTAFGMGKRGQRFSMIVNDGVVEQLNVEAHGEFKVSSADHMLDQLYAHGFPLLFRGGAARLDRKSPRLN